MGPRWVQTECGYEKEELAKEQETKKRRRELSRRARCGAVAIKWKEVEKVGGWLEGIGGLRQGPRPGGRLQCCVMNFNPEVGESNHTFRCLD